MLSTRSPPTRTTFAAVALAWLYPPGVVAPIASARTPEQLEELLAFISMRLREDERKRLDDASGEMPGT